MIELRTPMSDDYSAMCRQIHESFGASEPDELQREQVLIDFGRFRIAYDTAARRVVGVSGELDRSDDRHRYLMANRGPQAHFAFHEDGYASWKVTPDWSDAPPKHGLRITDGAPIWSSTPTWSGRWAGRRFEARSPEALRRATLLFRTYPDPSCQTPF